MEKITVWDAYNEVFKVVTAKKFIPEEKSHHTADLIKNFIYIFGGEITSGVGKSMRILSSELLRFDTSKHEWQFLRCSGAFINGRKSHASCILNKFLIIHGGICEDAKYSNEFYAFLPDRTHWQKIDLHVSAFNKNGQVKPIANHKMVAVYQFPNSQELFGQAKGYPRDYEINFCDRIAYEGLYVFGGRFEDNTSSDHLYVISTEKSSWKSIEPQTVGKKPTSRYGHAMIYDRDKNWVLIYGGKTSDSYQALGKFNFPNKYRL